MISEWIDSAAMLVETEFKNKEYKVTPKTKTSVRSFIVLIFVCLCYGVLTPITCILLNSVLNNNQKIILMLPIIIVTILLVLPFKFISRFIISRFFIIS